jgi:hypothetical protein
VKNPEWLLEACRLELERPNDALDILFDHVDDMLLDGEFEQVNALIEQLDFEALGMGIDLVIGVLSITLAAAPLLPARAALYDRAVCRLEVLSPGRVDRLLSGLD